MCLIRRAEIRSHSRLGIRSQPFRRSAILRLRFPASRSTALSLKFAEPLQDGAPPLSHEYVLYALAGSKSRR